MRSSRPAEGLLGGRERRRDVGRRVRERDEASLVCGGRQVDALVEHRVEEGPELLGVRLLGVVEAPYRTRMEEEAEHAADRGGGGRAALARGGVGEPVGERPRARFERRVDAGLAELAERLE